MKYSLVINLDSRVLQIFDGSRIVGTLRKQGEAFALSVWELPAEEVEEVVKSVRCYTGAIGTSLASLAHDLPGGASRSQAIEAIGRIPPEARMLVHLGCGDDIRANWLNIDYRPDLSEAYFPEKGLLNWDLRVGLPLPDASVDVIYSSHFFEHLTLDEATNLLRECRRVLRPAGRFRAMLPDFAMCYAAYARGDEEFFREAIEYWHLADFLPPSQRGKMDVLSRAVHEFYTHKYMYDSENFSSLLNSTGFGEIRQASHDESIDSNAPVRVRYSFYMNAKRPILSARAD